MGSHLETQLRNGLTQPDTTQAFTAHLFRAGTRMFNLGACFGYLAITSLFGSLTAICLWQLYVGMNPQTLGLKLCFARFIHLAFICYKSWQLTRPYLSLLVFLGGLRHHVNEVCCAHLF